jgi:hypothetical protein
MSPRGWIFFRMVELSTVAFAGVRAIDEIREGLTDQLKVWWDWVFMKLHTIARWMNDHEVQKWIEEP